MVASCDLDFDPMTFIYEFDLSPPRCYTGIPKISFLDKGFRKLSYYSTIMENSSNRSGERGQSDTKNSSTIASISSDDTSTPTAFKSRRQSTTLEVQRREKNWWRNLASKLWRRLILEPISGAYVSGLMQCCKVDGWLSNVRARVVKKQNTHVSPIYWSISWKVIHSRNLLTWRN